MQATEEKSRYITIGVSALVVAAALVFGGTQALAATKPALTCDPPYYGACDSEAECQDICDVALPESIGHCVLGAVHCCECFF